MPEGDTVWRTAALLRQHLAGQVLTRCDVRVPRFATVDLTGAVVDEALSRGKHLFIRAGTASIHSHLKMDGSWRIGDRPMRPTYRARIILETNAIQAAGIGLGVLEILDRDHDGSVVAHLGPDLLGPDWDPRVAAANLTAEPGRPIAEALLDQRVLAGVGNVYCNELCFLSGHLPTTRSARSPTRVAWSTEPETCCGPIGPARIGAPLATLGRADDYGSTGARGRAVAAAEPESPTATPPPE